MGHALEWNEQPRWAETIISAGSTRLLITIRKVEFADRVWVWRIAPVGAVPRPIADGRIDGVLSRSRCVRKAVRAARRTLNSGLSG